MAALGEIPTADAAPLWLNGAITGLIDAFPSGLVGLIALAIGPLCGKAPRER